MTDGAARPAIPAAIADGRVIAVARGLTASVLPGIAAALYDAGILAFEVALDSPDALAGLAAVAGFGVAAGKDRLLVGAGTVLSVDAHGRARRHRVGGRPRDPRVPGGNDPNRDPGILA